MKAYKEYEHHFPTVLKSLSVEENQIRVEAEDNLGRLLALEIHMFGSGIIRMRTSFGEYIPIAYPVVREEALQAATLKTEETKDGYRFSSKDAAVEIDKEPFAFRVYRSDGVLACEENRDDVESVEGRPNQIPPAGYSMDEGEVKGMNLGFKLRYDEAVYGLGEHFTNFNRTGQCITMRNFDTLGCRDENAYKNIPFYISNYGYGLFVHNHSVFDFNIGTESNATISAHVPGASLEYYLIINSSMKKILSSFMKLTGPAVLPPKWSFGLWYSTGFKGSSRENAEKDAARFRMEEIPCDVLHFDCYWLREDRWCDFVWDDEMYPQHLDMIKNLKKQGYKICLWMNPYVTVTTDMYREGKEKGYFAKNAAGEPYEADLWHGLLSPCVLLDFTNPEAKAWFQDKVKKVLSEGVDVLKTDFGEDIPCDALFFNGMTGEDLRNVYSRLYNQTVFEASKECKGEENAVVWARSGCAGMQQFPVCWSGDPRSSYEGMAATLRAGLSMAMSGVPFWSHDMGGFYGKVTKDIFIRWSQFGLFTSHSRLHGTTTRQPWAYDEETKMIVKEAVCLRYKLMPYIWKTAKNCVEQGVPFIRPMVLECQEDKNTKDMWDQYFFGEDILVAPVFGGGMAERDVYLPEGEWEELLGEKRVFKGGRWQTFTCPLNYIPVFKRKGAEIETGDVKMYMEEPR
mgnify:CR=1 FL=1